MFGILCDYLNNGIYSNEREIINISGSTDFLWQKTIDETYPIIELTADKKRDFSDDTYILNRIENELRTQFDDHRIMLLKAMRHCQSWKSWC